MFHSVISILVFILVAALGGLFAGAETGMYRVSRVRLRLGIGRKNASYILLGKAIEDGPGLLLSLLVGTNMAHYLATSMVTFMLLGRIRAEETAELFAALITAPILFIFSELIPKNIFYYRADYLMPVFAPLFFTLHKILTLSGIIPLLKAVSRLFARLTGTAVTAKAGISDVRELHIRTILEETRDEAVLSPVQSEIISRVVSIPQIRLRSVMTGLGKVQAVHRKADRASLLDLLRKSTFTRFPVYDRSPTDIVGYIDIYQALNATNEFTDLQEHIRPICTLAEDMAVVDAIRIMQKENHKIVLVAGPGTLSGQRNVGIVTMKDLVEELLGELTEW